MTIDIRTIRLDDLVVTSLDDALDTIGDWTRAGNARAFAREASAAGMLPTFLQRGAVLDILSGETSGPDPLNGDIAHGMSLADADLLHEHYHEAHVRRSMPSMACHVSAILVLHSRVDNTFDIRGVVPEYVRPLFCEDHDPFRSAALPGDPDDIRVTDDAARADVLRGVRISMRDGDISGGGSDGGSRRPSGLRERGERE